MRKRDAIRAAKAVRRSNEQEDQSILRRERRRHQIKVTARKRKTKIKIVIGAEALRMDAGEISESRFQRILSDSRREIEETDRMLAQVRCASPEKREDSRRKSPRETTAAGGAEAQTAEPANPMVAVYFWPPPPKEFRERIQQELGLAYDGADYHWRGRSDPKTVKAMLRANGFWGQVQAFKVSDASS